MSEVLFELEQVLRSKQHKLTIQETDALINCKSKALRGYCVGAIFGAGVSWLATSKFNVYGRISVSAGVSVLAGLWRLGSSLDSCVDHILALEGSRMQRELANIVVRKYSNDPWRMRLVTKHFYSEEVFDDSNSDKPKLRWRYRNFFSDNVDYGQRTEESNPSGDFQSDSHSDSRDEHNNDMLSGSHGARAETREESEGRKFNSVPKRAPTDSAGDAMDPLDCVFGYPAMVEIHHTNPSTTSPKNRTRKDRRAHRRRRMRHHHDVLLNPPQHA